MTDSTRALRDIVATLAGLDGIHAHLCDGDPHAAVAWSDRAQITVRLQAAADDEIWVLAGAGLPAREIADSEGGFELEPLVKAILDGRAIETFGPVAGRCGMVPLGWLVETAGGGTYAGGIVQEPGRTIDGLMAGPFAKADLEWPPRA